MTGTGTATDIQSTGADFYLTGSYNGLFFIICFGFILGLFLRLILGLFFRLLLRGFTLYNRIVIRILQGDPALRRLAPNITAAAGGAGNFQSIALICLADDRICRTGTSAQIHIAAGNGDLHTGTVSLIGGNKVLGIGQIDPAAVIAYKTPLCTGSVRILGNDLYNLTVLISIHDQRTLERLLERIQNARGDLLFIVYGFAGDLLCGILRTACAVTSAPVGIERIALHTCIQFGDLFATGGISIPAIKNKIVVCRHSTDRRRGIDIKTLNLDFARTAVGIKLHIAVTRRGRLIINTVQVHVGLSQAAADQSGDRLAATVTPLRKSENEIIALPAFHNRSTQRAGLVQPGSTTVEGQRKQRVKLCLGQFQTELIGKAVDRSAHAVQELLQQRFRLIHGNAVCLVLRQLAVRHSGAIANRPLGIVPIGMAAEAFKFLQNTDHIIACFEIRGRIGSNRTHGDQAQHQRNGQNIADNSFFHELYSFQIRNHRSAEAYISCIFLSLGGIITEVTKDCNPSLPK